LLQLCEGCSHGFGIGRLRRAFSRDRCSRTDRLLHIGFEEWRVRSPLFNRQVGECASLLDQPSYERSNNFMRLAKRDTFRYEIVGDVCGQQQT